MHSPWRAIAFVVAGILAVTSAGLLIDRGSSTLTPVDTSLPVALVTGTEGFPTPSTGSETWTSDNGILSVSMERDDAWFESDSRFGTEHSAVAAEAHVSIASGPPGLVGVGCSVDRDHAYRFMLAPRSGRWLIEKRTGSTLEPLTGGHEGSLESLVGLPIRAECVAGAGATRLVFLADGDVVGAYDDVDGWSSFSAMVLAGETIGQAGVHATFADVSMSALTDATPVAVVAPPLQRAKQPDGYQARLADDFTGPSLFGESRNAQRVFASVDGEYRILVRQPDSWWWWGHWVDEQSRSVSVKAFARSADVTSAGGRFGVLCVESRYVSYAFLVEPDEGVASIWLYTKNDHQLIGMATTPTVRFGTLPDLVSGTCTAEGGKVTLDMAVNGYQVLSETDPSSSADGFIGVALSGWSGTDELDARIDEVSYATRD